MQNPVDSSQMSLLKPEEVKVSVQFKNNYEANNGSSRGIPAEGVLKQAKTRNMEI